MHWRYHSLALSHRYVHFLFSLDTEMAQVVAILPHGQSGPRRKCVPDVNASCCHFQEKLICNVVDRLFSLCSAATLWQIHLASIVRKVDFLDTAILQKRAFYWQNEWHVQSQLRYIFNSESHNILNRNSGVTFKETFGVTKSRCSRTDLSSSVLWSIMSGGRSFTLWGIP